MKIFGTDSPDIRPLPTIFDDHLGTEFRKDKIVSYLYNNYSRLGISIWIVSCAFAGIESLCGKHTLNFLENLLSSSRSFESGYSENCKKLIYHFFRPPTK